LGGTAVVKLDGKLLGGGLVIPSGCSELSLLDLVLSGGIATLDQGDSQKGSEDGLYRKITQGGKTSLGVGQVITRGKGGRESVASSGDDVSKDGKLGNAAVLGLNLTKAVESGLVSSVKKTKRIPEAKRSCNMVEKIKKCKRLLGITNFAGKSD